MSFRWSMSWFIFSEVMFFAAFFGALFYIRNLSVPDLGSLGAKLLWPDYTSAWPTVGPYIKEQFTPMGAMGIPLLNTIMLLTSGVTLTVAHHALKAGHRGTLKLWLSARSRWASRSSASRPTSTPRVRASSTSSCRPASTARRSSC